MVLGHKIKIGIDSIREFFRKSTKNRIKTLSEDHLAISANQSNPLAAWEQIKSEIDYLRRSFDEVIRDTESWGETYGDWLDKTEKQLAQAQSHIRNMERGHHPFQSRRALGQVYEVNSGPRLKSAPGSSEIFAGTVKTSKFKIDVKGPACINEKSAREIWAKIDHLHQAFKQTSLSADLLGTINAEQLRHKDERLAIAEESINELNLKLCETQKGLAARIAAALLESAGLKDRVAELSQTLALTESSRQEIESKCCELEIQRNQIEQLLRSREDEYRRILEENDRTTQELKPRLAQKDEEIKILKNSHEEFKRDLELLESGKRSLEAEYEDLRKSKNDLESLLRIREEEFERITQKDRQIRSGLDEELARLRGDYQVLQEHVRTAVNNTEGAEAQRLAAEKERDQFKLLNENQEQTIRAHQLEIVRLIEDSERIQKENRAGLEDSLCQVQKLQSEIDDLTQNVARLENEKKAAESAQSEIAQKTNELENLVKTRDTEVAGFREEIRQIREGYEAELTSKQQALTEMQSSLEQWTQRFEGAEAQRRELESGKEQLHQQKEEVESTLRSREALWLQASEEQRLIREQLERSLAEIQSGAQSWENQAGESKLRLESLESEKRSAGAQRDELAQKISEFERQLKIHSEDQIRIAEEASRSRHEIESRMAATRDDAQRWQKQTQELMNQIEALETNRRSVQLEQEALESKKSELEKLLVSKDAERANLVQIKDGYFDEINRWKTTCKKVEKEMTAAREAFVRKLALCTEEIEEWKRKAAQNLSKPEIAEMFERPNENGAVCERNSADSILKQALDKARDASNVKEKTPYINLEIKPGDSHSETPGGIYELRRFQEIVEKG